MNPKEYVYSLDKKIEKTKFLLNDFRSILADLEVDESQIQTAIMLRMYIHTLEKEIDDLEDLKRFYAFCPNPGPGPSVCIDPISRKK